MKEVSGGPTSTIGYSYLGCTPANVDSNDFYGDVAWAYISSYSIGNAGATWKKSAGSDYWLARELMRSKDYQGAYNLCMDLFQDSKTENRSECLQLAMQAAKKMHTFSEEETFLKTSLQDQEREVREAAEVWLSIFYEHVEDFEKAQSMIDNTTLTGENKLSMLFNLAAACDDADYDEQAVDIFRRMIKEFPKEEKEVLEFIREMHHGSSDSNGSLGKSTIAATAPENGTRAYPNPFNASTSISYNVPRSEHVRIQIYDILGRKVKCSLMKLSNQVSIPLHGTAQTNGVRLFPPVCTSIRYNWEIRFSRTRF